MRTDDMTEKQSREAGFTLLEVIIAISILTVGLLGVATMQTAAIRGNDAAYRITESVTWAQDRLEHLLALPYDSLSIGPDQTDPFGDPEITYDVEYPIVDGETNENLKKVKVSVKRNNRGATKTRSLSSIKSKI